MTHKPTWAQLDEWRKLAVKDPTRVPQTLSKALREACDHIEVLEDRVPEEHICHNKKRADEAEAKVQALEARLKAAEAVCHAAEDYQSGTYDVSMIRIWNALESWRAQAPGSSAEDIVP